MLVVTTFEVVVYQRSDGERPFEEWFGGLDRAAVEKVIAALQRMAQGNLGDSKPVGAGVVERRIEEAHGRWADYQQRRKDQEQAHGQA